jgi:hypothetical protein
LEGRGVARIVHTVTRVLEEQRARAFYKVAFDLAVARSIFSRFFFVEDPDAYKVEVLQRSGRFR